MRLFPVRVVSAVRLLLVLALVLPAPAITQVRPAQACSGPGTPPPEERFGVAAVPSEILGPNGIAFLGAVLDETQLDTPHQTVYLSNVQNVVPLTGEGIEAVVRVGPNGFGAPDCSGGPRLFPGEKVMLFLYPSRGVLGAGDPAQFGDWQSGQFGTPILFDGDDAYYLSWGRFADPGDGQAVERRTHIGNSAEVLALALEFFQVSAGEREQAFQFVLGTPAPPKPPPAPTSPREDVRISPPDTGSGGLLSPLR